MRGAWVFFCVGGLVAVSGAWLIAAVIALVRPDGHTCMTFGYARPDAWVPNVVVYSDGFVLAQHFHQNLTQYDGPYAKLTRVAQFGRNRSDFRADWGVESGVALSSGVVRVSNSVVVRT